MYTCVRAFMRLKGDNQHLIEYQVGTTNVRGLLADYTLVYLILTHPSVEGEMSLDLRANESLVYEVSPEFTVNQWLVSIGNTTLPTSDLLPSVKTKYVYYRDAFSAGYDIQKIHPSAGIGNEMPDPELRDLILTKYNTNYQTFFDHCLVTVNGLFHLTDYSEEGVVVKEGGRSVYVGNNNHVGIHSFEGVGKVEMVPITEGMIHARQSLPLSRGITLNLEGHDISNKVVMLSIGGYLHFSDQYYKIVGENSIRVEWYNIPLAHRYLNSKAFVDLSAFESTMQRNANHGDSLDLEQASTDEAIKAYMTMSQSFVILIETDHFYITRHKLEQTGLPGRYYSYEKPLYPIQMDNGFFPEYLFMNEAGRYSIMVSDNLAKRYLNESRPTTEDNYFHPAVARQQPRSYMGAYLLEMGSEVVVFEEA